MDIGHTVTLYESALLIAGLMTDPSSLLQAAKNKWKYPVTREWIVLAHLFDLISMVNSKKKPKPYPTPYAQNGESRIGGVNQNTAVVRERLNAMNPKDNNGK